ncbi:putative bifunctional diguanylate cyclase/phosphodiesterase [Pseudomonas shirazensis]
MARKFPDTSQWPRIQLLLRFSGVACILHGTLWGVYYATHAMLLLAVLLFTVVLSGLACLYLATQPTQRALPALAHCLLIATVIASLADSATADTSRSANLFLIPIGVAAFLLFRNSGIYLRWVFPCLCFAGLVFFANSPLTFSRLELLPSDISQFGHALNSITAMALTLGVLAIFRDEQKFKVELHSALARALARRELCTYLQPQVCAQGRVIGAEALLRWDRPGHGIQSPAEFIPVAEQSGLIHDIGLMVLEQACRQLSEWSEHRDAQHWKLSVNVSPLQLTSSTFVEEVREIVHKFNIPANRLRLEITESVFASDLVATVMKMEDLRSDGISWSLDDFGTGFSSLALLRELPLDELKIDRSFIVGIESDKGKYELIRKIIEIAEILNISTVAEGVETEAQFDCLQAMGCTAFQGFYFGRPMIAAQFIGKYAAS